MRRRENATEKILIDVFIENEFCWVYINPFELIKFGFGFRLKLYKMFIAKSNMVSKFQFNRFYTSERVIEWNRFSPQHFFFLNAIISMQIVEFK